MPPSLLISPLLPTDVDAAYHLADDEPAVHGELLWHVHTPWALALKAELDGQLVGYAIGHAHADTAWLREVYVDPVAQDQGVGTALVQAALRWMEEQGATAQGVVAVEGTEHFWERFGFVPEVPLLQYSGGKFFRASLDEVVDLEPHHLLAALHLDRRATGEDRSTWLRERLYLGNVWLEGGRVRGFLLPLAGHGLIVADSALVGLELQRWLWPIQESIILPAGATEAHAHLTKCGYTTRSAGVRHWRGPAPTLRMDMVYAWPQGWMV